MCRFVTCYQTVHMVWLNGTCVDSLQCVETVHCVMRCVDSVHFGFGVIGTVNDYCYQLGDCHGFLYKELDSYLVGVAWGCGGLFWLGLWLV